MSWIEDSRRLQRQGRPFALATIVQVDGSAPRDAAVHMLVEPDGTVHGTIGGGAVEHEVREQCRQVMREGSSRLEEFLIDGEEGRPLCGGRLQVFIEPVTADRQLYIFGAGHVGVALARIMAPTNYGVTLIDERQDYPRTAISGTNVIHHSFNSLPEQLLFHSERTHIVVVTYDHARDLEVVRSCLQHPWRYLGMIASRTKAQQVRSVLVDEGVDAELLDQLQAPIGLPGVGSKDPAEIAVSIAAQLLQRDE